MKLLPVALSVLALHGAAPATSVQFVLSRQQPDGGFAEPGRRSTAGATAWAALALKAAGTQPARATDAAAFLARQEQGAATEVELTTLAIAALGHPVDGLAAQIEGLRRPDGRIGGATRSTIWGMLALRAAGHPPRPATLRWLLAQQTRRGGWSSYRGGRADADDTAVAVEALRSAGISPRGRAITRALAFLHRSQNADGGFGRSPGEPSNAQSTAWALQAFAAAGRTDGVADARTYLAKLRRADGSYRYDAGSRTTPLRVTSEVLPALVSRPFPLG